MNLSTKYTQYEQIWKTGSSLYHTNRLTVKKMGIDMRTSPGNSIQQVSNGHAKDNTPSK